MNSPYIGVTGFVSEEEVHEVLKVVPVGSQRKLMVGVLASSKTIKGNSSNQSKRQPAPDEIAKIFPDHPAVLNLIHFNTREPEKLLSQLLEATELGGKNLHGFQLNIKWPSSHILWEYKKQHPEKVLVLQCGNGALDAVGRNLRRLIETVSGYFGICDYLLIDGSGGRGKILDPISGFEYLKYLNETIRGMNFGIAGGLSAETIDLLQSIAKKFPCVSIDAESRLRDEDDSLDVSKAKSFVTRAYELFC